MKTCGKLISLITCGALLMLTLIYIGCEESPDNQDLDQYFNDNPFASPANNAGDQHAGLVTIEIIQGDVDITEVGQVISVRALGGHEPYTWSVADTTRGSIDVRQSNEAQPLYTAVYTALQVSQNTISVADASGMTGVLNVGPRAESALAIVPNPVTFGTNVAINTTFQLFASGGIPPYRWDTDSPSWLSVTPSTGSNTTVRFVQAIVNSDFSMNILVFDEGGNYAASVIVGK